MTETEIERTVERRMDRLDHQYMTTNMTKDEYTDKIKRINAWAKESLKNHRSGSRG